MNHFDPNTRFPDGSYRYLPDQSVIDEVVRRRELGSENVPAGWEAPADVTELLGRVYGPDSVPEMWTRFFSGEELEGAEIKKIRAALKPHTQRPPDSGLLGDEQLLRARKEIESALEQLSWLDAASEEGHWQIIRHSAGHVAAKLSERAGLEKQKASIDFLFDLKRDEIRAGARRDRDLHLLYLLAEGIVKAQERPSASRFFPDEYMHLLPAGTAETIRWYKDAYARRAELERQEKEEQRLKQIEEAEREKIERLAAVEEASFDELLDLLFGHNPDLSILDSFRRREKLTTAQLDVLIDLKDTVDPVRRRGYERLIELGSSVGIAVLTIEEIEDLQASMLREAEDAKERETAATLRWIEEAHWPELCSMAISRNLVPGEWHPWLHRVTDVERVYRVRDHFAAMVGRQTDPIDKRICEMLAARALSRNQGTPGAVGMRG